MNERIEQGNEPSIEDIKKRMEETNNESFYQAREQMRQVYTDAKGEYVNCDRNKYHITNDSFDIVYTTGKAITFKELFKDMI